MFSDYSEPGHRGKLLKYHHHLCDHHHDSPSKSAKDNPCQEEVLSLLSKLLKVIAKLLASEIIGQRTIFTKPQQSSLNKPLPPLTHHSSLLPVLYSVFSFSVCSLEAPNGSLNVSRLILSLPPSPPASPIPPTPYTLPSQLRPLTLPSQILSR